jgi:uracil-DNA glycosylase
VFVANVLKSRPPGNRDPQPDEIEACKPYLWRQIQLIEPKVICTLGNFATKLLTRSNRGITQVHGKPQETELGGRRVILYPLFHPAAGLRTPATKQALQEDFAGLPALLASVEPEPEPVPEPVAASQLDLFG